MTKKKWAAKIMEGLSELGSDVLSKMPSISEISANAERAEKERVYRSFARLLAEEVDCTVEDLLVWIRADFASTPDDVPESKTGPTSDADVSDTGTDPTSETAEAEAAAAQRVEAAFAQKGLIPTFRVVYRSVDKKYEVRAEVYIMNSTTEKVRSVIESRAVSYDDLSEDIRTDFISGKSEVVYTLN